MKFDFLIYVNDMHSCEWEIENVYCSSIISSTADSKTNPENVCYPDIFLNFLNEGEWGESAILEFYQQFA